MEHPPFSQTILCGMAKTVQVAVDVAILHISPSDSPGLPQMTRLCQSASNVETPIEFIELFVKLDNVNIKEIEKNVLSGMEEDLQRTYDILQSDFGKMNVHVCGGIGGWRRVVYLNMTDPNTNCPSGWKITDFSKRTCDTGQNGYLTCDSAFFPVSGGAYNKVCGTIIGYQYQSTGAFQN